MHRVLITLLLCSIALPAAAQSAALSRRDAFLQIWASINRPTQDSREVPFSDVAEGDTGFAEITYAKYRGILDDSDAEFHPNATVSLQDTVLWLFRARSVAPIEDITVENIPTLLERYPIVYLAEHERDSVSNEMLVKLMQDLDKKLAEEEHEVSLYSEKFHGKGTAFGETFDMNALTAAHVTFPWNTLVKVTNVENNKSVIVRINDRGPFVPGRDMDLSLAAFTTIAERSKGVIHATFKRLGDASLVGGCKEEEPRYQQRIVRDVRFTRGVPWKLAQGQSIHLRANKPFVIRAITYPDGTTTRVQDFILKDEQFSFTPSQSGKYELKIGTIDGRARWFTTVVESCS